MLPRRQLLFKFAKRSAKIVGDVDGVLVTEEQPWRHEDNELCAFHQPGIRPEQLTKQWKIFEYGDAYNASSPVRGYESAQRDRLA